MRCRGGTLGVTGATTLSGALAANGGVNCDSGKFTIADTSGNTVIGGTLNVAGASTFTGAVTQVATPVFRHVTTTAPTNVAAYGFTVTVDGTNYVLGLYNN